MEKLFDAIKGARFFSMRYHAIGMVRGGLLKNDAVTEFRAQVFPYGTAVRRSVEGLEGLDVPALYAGLSRGVLVQDYKIPKKHGGGVVTEVLTVADIEAARLREVESLLDPAGRAARYTQAGVWSLVSPGVFAKIKDPDVLYIRAYKVPGSGRTITEPVNGYHVANSTRETRSAEVVRGWMRAGDLRAYRLNRVLTLNAGGERWQRGTEGLLRAC